MPEKPIVYHQENGASLIEIRLGELRQLFNTLDPSPFHHKDLDQDAEEYLVETAHELPSRAPIKIRIYLPEKERPETETIDISRAVHNYFGYRLWVLRSRLRDLIRRGRDALIIGLAFLAATLIARHLLLANGGAITQLSAEGLEIAGWVALWQPVQIFFYDWRPLKRTVQLYDRLSVADVDLRFIPE